MFKHYGSRLLAKSEIALKARLTVLDDEGTPLIPNDPFKPVKDFLQAIFRVFLTTVFEQMLNDKS